jgi:CheY-like chemotaxis protein
MADLDGQAPSKHPQRAFIRWPFHKPAIRVEMRQATGSVSDLHYACRNLSGTGISLLHNSYVHTGTTCTVHLPLLVGGTAATPGKVMRCRHVKGLIHELGIKFLAPINIRDFVSIDATKGGFTLEAVDAAKLTGVLLHIDDSTMTRRLIRHHLRDTQLEIVNAETAEDGLKRSGEGFDMILCDYDLAGCPGPEMVEKLRNAGATVPILMLTADVRAALQNDKRDNRANSYLQLPVSQEQLLRGLAEFLLTDGNAADAGGPMYSTLSPDHPTAGFVGEYVDDLKKNANELSKAVQTEDAGTIRRVCNDIKSVAPELGFVAISEAAIAVVIALDASMSVPDSLRQIRTLISMCLRAKVR